MSDYADILKGGWDNIPEPKLLPVGSWLLRARNANFMPSADGDKPSVVMFVHEAKEPMDDVDAEELSSLGEDYNISENRLFTRVNIETGSDWKRVKDLLDKHGVSTEGKSIEESLKAVRGSEVVGFIEQKQYKNRAGELVTGNNVTAFVKVEE